MTVDLDVQIRSFQNVYLILDQSNISPSISRCNDYCDRTHAPYGFPNHICVDYELVKNSYQKATMTLSIQSNTSGISFNRIEVVSIDANPKRCGMGSMLFEQAKAVAVALGD